LCYANRSFYKEEEEDDNDDDSDDDDDSEEPFERIEGIVNGITVEVYSDGDDRLKYKAKNEVGSSKLMYAGKPANKKGWCKRCANHCANALYEATLDDAIPCSSHKV
jgi:hypothetical protein